MPEEDQDLFERFHKDFDIEFFKKEFTLKTNYLTIWSICSAIQLACRHPGFKGPTRQIVEEFAGMVFDQIATTPALKEVADKGWRSEFDF